MKKTILTVTTTLLLIGNSLLPTFSFAQYTNLLNFSGTANGNQPYGSLVSDGTSLYGMTEYGGTNSAGVLFNIKTDGTDYSKLLNFYGINGSYPTGSLLAVDSFLYGMTEYGGTSNFGSIFKIKPDGTGYAKLFDFSGTSNGQYPTASLISDGTFLYGMTGYGGLNGFGVIFKIKPDGTGYSKMLDFSGTANGSTPLGSLISDGTFLYGMTHDGGTNGLGVIFKIKPDASGYAKLLDFTGSNGKFPSASLISDGTFLYGTTVQGGTNSMGAIFKIKPDGTGYEKLFDFSGTANGKAPYGSLFYDTTFLYGMTSYGGTSNNGVMFKIKPDGTGFSNLLNFSGAANGQNPNGALVAVDSFLYGMTGLGGANNKGTVFKYNPYCHPVTYSQSLVIAGDSSITVGSHTYTASGTYTDVLRALSPLRAFSTCDSTVTTILNVLKSTQSDTVCAGQIVTVGSHTYSSSGTYHDTLTSLVYGLDSTITTNLTVLPANTFTQSQAKCFGDSVKVGSHIYKVSGTYHDTLTSLVNSCDSVIITHLAIISGSTATSSQTLTLCAGHSLTVGTATHTTSGTFTDHFTSSGCDSAVTSHLTVLPAYTSSQTRTVCHGQSFSVGNHTYHVSGTYVDTLATLVHGCDSVVTTHLTVSPAITITQSPTKCPGQSLTVGSHIYTVTGTYNDTLTSIHGCDSAVTTHLTVLSGAAASYSQTLTRCTGQSVTVGTATYLTTGNYTYHFTSTGCDSTVITHLTVFPALTSITQSPTVCSGQSLTVGNHTYTTGGTYHDTLASYHGCDSAVTTHLTVIFDSTSTSQTLTICPGESVIVGTATYTTAGNYTYHFTGGGCDSVVTTHLTINNMNVTTVNSTATLTSSATGATYQWINCGDGNSPIAGQNNQSFTADANGSYAVIVIKNGNACTSTCHNFSTIGILENSLETSVNIYPNPFTYQTTISFAQEQKNTLVKIVDLLGKEIKSIAFSGRELTIEKGEMKAGIYFVQIIDENKNVVNNKIIIQ